MGRPRFSFLGLEFHPRSKVKVWSVWNYQSLTASRAIIIYIVTRDLAQNVRINFFLVFISYELDIYGHHKMYSKTFYNHHMYYLLALYIKKSVLPNIKFRCTGFQ